MIVIFVKQTSGGVDHMHGKVQVKIISLLYERAYYSQIGVRAGGGGLRRKTARGT